MTIFPTNKDFRIAEALVERLVARGGNPRLDADGNVRFGGKITERERAWGVENREAFRGALVAAGRFIRGTLDRIYELGGGQI